MKKFLTMFILAVTLAGGCSFGPGPKDVTSKYLDSYYHGDFTKAYELLSSPDKAVKTQSDYVSASPLGAGFLKSMADKVTYEVKEVKVTGDKAVVAIDLTVPDVSSAMAEVMGTALKAAFGGAKTDEKEMGKTIVEKVKGKDLPKIKSTVFYDLVKEKDGWRIYMGWEHEKRIKELRVEAEKLEKQKKFQEAKQRYEEVVKLSSRDEEAPKKAQEMDKRLAEYKAKQAYFASIEVRGIRTGKDFIGETGIFGELKNKGDKSLKTVEVTVYCLDKDGKVISEAQRHPVLVSDFSYAMRDNGPLKPNYSRQFGYKLQPPSDWSGKVKVEVTDVEFE